MGKASENTLIVSGCFQLVALVAICGVAFTFGLRIGFAVTALICAAMGFVYSLSAKAQRKAEKAEEERIAAERKAAEPLPNWGGNRA